MYTHNLFPYPAKFPPEPIREFIGQFTRPGDWILDPFCGSGTVLVEALLHGRSAHGIELNPVAALISRAKATIYTDEHLAELDRIINDLETASSGLTSWLDQVVTSADIPNYKNIGHWFQPNMIRELAALRKFLVYGENRSHAIHNLLWMAFLRIIVPISNQDGDTRYARVDKPELIDGFAVALQLKILREYSGALQKNLGQQIDKHNVTVDVTEGDTISVLPRLPNDQFSLVITSPPYLNTYDYYLYHKHRIFWMKRNPKLIRQQEVGCHHRVDRMSYEEALGHYRGYLDIVLHHLHTKLRRHGRVVMLIGDGIVKDKVVKAGEVIAELAAENGYCVEETRTRKLRGVSKGFIKGERLDRKDHHLVVLRKDNNAPATS